MTALRPEPQTLLTVYAAMLSGSPAFSAAWRAGFCPRPAWRTLPTITSSIRSAGALARRRASAMAKAPSCGAGTSARPPRYLPIGVRTADRIRASLMFRSSKETGFHRHCTERPLGNRKASHAEPGRRRGRGGAEERRERTERVFPRRRGAPDYPLRFFLCAPLRLPGSARDAFLFHRGR